MKRSLEMYKSCLCPREPYFENLTYPKCPFESAASIVYLFSLPTCLHILFHQRSLERDVNPQPYNHKVLLASQCTTARAIQVPNPTYIVDREVIQ